MPEGGTAAARGRVQEPCAQAERDGGRGRQDCCSCSRRLCKGRKETARHRCCCHPPPLAGCSSKILRLFIRGREILLHAVIMAFVKTRFWAPLPTLQTGRGGGAAAEAAFLPQSSGSPVEGDRAEGGEPSASKCREVGGGRLLTALALPSVFPGPPPRPRFGHREGGGTSRGEGPGVVDGGANLR